MAREIGQIIYNVKDYTMSGGLISTKKNDLKSIIKEVDGESYAENRVDITTDLVQAYKLGGITKIGIQAPPGTKFVLNALTGNSEDYLIMGRNGVYELDEDEIVIKYLRFEKPKKYILDEKTTNNYKTSGVTSISEAEQTRIVEMKKLFPNDDEIKITKDNIEQYNKIQNDYYIDYLAGYEQYLTGVTGVYMDSGETEELYNIIIDFVYDTSLANETEKEGDN